MKMTSTYDVYNNADDTLYVVSKAGFRYPVLKNMDESSIRSDCYIVYELNAVDINKIVFYPELAMTPFDKLMIQALEDEKNRMLKKNFELTHSNFVYGTRNLVINLTLFGNLCEAGGEIRSELLGISIWRGIDYQNAPPTCTPLRIAHELVEKEYETVSIDPNSVELVPIEESVVEDSLEEPSSSHWGIFVNDPTNISDTLWVNMMGRAIAIPVTKDSNAPGGIYCALRQGKNKPQSVYYDFDDLDKNELAKCGIFLSRTEALKGGNSERYLQAEERLNKVDKENWGLRKELDSKSTMLNKQEILNSRLNWEMLTMKTELRIKDLIGKLVTEKSKPSKDGKGDNIKSFLDFVSNVTQQITNNRRLA